MKRLLLFLLIIFGVFKSYSQISFEEGYIIFNNDDTLKCLIKNLEWKNNPTTFKYKLTEVSDPQIATLREVKEFGVQNYLKYKRTLVKIDRSSDSQKNFSKSRVPEFHEDILFLKQLVKGKGNLYVYSEGNMTRYFYNIDNSEIKQLIYRRYWVTKSVIGTDKRFIGQILAELKCESINQKYVKNIQYRSDDLIKCFNEYNNCTNSEYVDFEKLRERKSINLSIRPGFKKSTFNINNSLTDNRDINFGEKYNYRLGIEFEFILPFNKNKWAITIEPTYQYYSAEEEIIYLSTGTIIRTTNVEVDYKSVELPISLRHYIYLNNNSKLFVNVGYVIDLSFDSFIKAERTEIMDFEISSRQNFIFGLGYNYNERYTFEMRYDFDRRLLGNEVYWDSDYSSISVILGYNLLGKKKK